MADSAAHLPGLLPRHSAVTRFTHWVNTLSFLALLVSGVAILLAHPRFYWGETGVAGGPSLFDLPLPFVLTGQTGWGRYLHFLAAWIFVINGLLYLSSGIFARAFYSPLQRLAYLAVSLVLAPLTVWTGLAMSPALTSAYPSIVTVLGGQQSARTIHFIAAGILVLFLLVHITMISFTGFTARMRGMIIGTDLQ